MTAAAGAAAKQMSDTDLRPGHRAGPGGGGGGAAVRPAGARRPCGPGRAAAAAAPGEPADA